MSNEHDDPPPEGEGGGASRETARPPAPYTDADADEKTVISENPAELLAARRKASGGLRQMFSRDPAPVRESLPTADEGDALLDMLFEDAARTSQEPDEPTLDAPPPEPILPMPSMPARPPPRPAGPPKLPVRPPRVADARNELETLDAEPGSRPSEPEAIETPMLDLDASIPEPEAETTNDGEVVDEGELHETSVEVPRLSVIPSHPPEALSFDGEEDAAAQLAEADLRDAWIARAAWLREEALADPDRASRSRGLLVVSELLAMAGDAGAARSAAAEARELAPTSPLPHRQIRGLMMRESDFAGAMEAIDAETKSVSNPAARCHLVLVGAEIARIGLGDEEQAKKRVELALRVLPSDPRPHVFRLGVTLAEADATEAGGALTKTRFPPDAVELAPLARALGSLLAHRGIAPKTRDATTPYEALLRARADFEAAQPALAMQHLAGVDTAPALAGGIGWLLAALAAPRKETRALAVERLRGVLDGSHGPLARRALAARAIELGDADAAKSATETTDTEAFTAADRVALTALSGGSRTDLETWSEPLWNDEELAPIAAAVDAALESPSAQRLPRPLGSQSTRAGVTLGRALSTGADSVLADAVALYADAKPSSGIDRALALELDVEAAAGGRIAQAVRAWRDDGELERERLLASALIGEVSGEAARAQDDFEKVRALDPTFEAAVRARLPNISDEAAAAMLAEHAEALERGPRPAILLTEAAIRVADDAEKSEALLRRAADLEPQLPFPPHLGERAARARGDRDALIEWLRTRREASTDPVEQAHDIVREALLLSDADGSPASGLLEQALKARLGDVGLRELYERLSPEPPADRAAWRLERAREAEGAEAARLSLEAAFEFERLRDWEKVGACAKIAFDAGERDLSPILAYRAAIAGQGAGDVIDSLMPKARETEDATERREIYERLAELDEHGRSDAASGLLWRRTILEETPGHLLTLRRVASALVTAGRDDDLEPIVLEIARALDGAESVAHAMLASRLRIRASGWDDTREAVEIAFRHHPRTIWTLRQMEAHARAKGDHELALDVDRQLIERTQRPSEAATLALRAAQSATKAGMSDEALAFLAHAIELAPNHLVAHLELAVGLESTGSFAGAAASYEAAANASVGPAERMHDFYKAALLWQDKANEPAHARAALEKVAEIDPAYADVFERLQTIYVAGGARAELAALLERRLDAVTDPHERVEMEVLRGRALADVGDATAAKRALAAALEANPDHVDALSAFADVAASEGDFTGAEQAWIRLARLVSDPSRQADIYLRLGELYDEHVPNAERAELAYNEILKRKPDDSRARERLVALFLRNGDGARALEQQTILINAAQTPEEKCQRTTELANLHESAGDVKKAEATLLQARKTWPKDDVALAALARFYHRNNQAPAAQVLLDRAVADARRALSTGRFEPYLFSTIATVAALRNRPDAARAAQTAVAALEGNVTDLDGAGGRAGDARLDDLLAPEAMSPNFRELLRRTGQLLDAAMPFDLTSIRATPLPPQQRELNDLVRALGQGYGLPAMNVYTSSALGQVCVPVSAYPPALVLGQALIANPREDVRAFLVHRALKILQTNASALSRTAPIDLWPLLAAYLKAMNPNWNPQGVDAGKLTEFYARITRSMQGPADPQVGMLASEVIGSLGNRASTLNTVVNGWGDRAALLATGDLNIALVAIAWSSGHTGGPPGAGKDRVTWIGRNAEARELVVFSVSDAYADARARLGLGTG